MKKFFSVTSLTMLVVAALGTSNALAGAQLVSGNIALGVNDEGHLNTSGAISTINTDNGELGLAYNFGTAGTPVWRDATAPGCLCEGWGVSGSGFTGFANVATDGGANNLSVTSFTATPTSITSSVKLTSFVDLAVTQVYAASAAAPGALFENKVTITNNGVSSITALRYVRVMDWDVPLTEFNEFVTIQGTATTADLELSHDDGFETANPLAATSEILAGTTNVDFEDSGPTDHGAYFKFLFGDLAAGASKTFSIFYGAAANETDMLAALGAVGIELFSLGQSNVDGAAFNDGPTFAFGFKGVGGVIIVDPDPVPEPASMLLFGAGITGLAALRRRRS